MERSGMRGKAPPHVSRMRRGAKHTLKTLNSVSQLRCAERCAADPGPHKIRSFGRSRVCSAPLRFASCCAAPGKQACIAALALALGVSLVHAQGAPDFYKGKQITLIVGYEAGNDYDIGARMLARYLPRHIPGHANISVQNIPQRQRIADASPVYVPAP